MKPIVVLTIVVIALVLILGIFWLTARRTNMHHREYSKAQIDLKLYGKAVSDIWDKVELYRDMESVLATHIRAILRQLDKERQGHL